MQSDSARPGDIVRIRGERWLVRSRTCYARAALLDVEGYERTNRGERARFLLPSESVERERPPRAPKSVSLAAWRRMARPALTDATPNSWSLLGALGADFALMPYQLEPALAMLQGRGCRFLIADEVGLGKTVQAGLMIAELLARHPDGRTLVVTPAGLRDQWCSELTTRFHLHPCLFEAVTVARQASRLPGHVNPWRIEPLIVASVDYVKRPEVLRSLETIVWDIVIFDEAHTLCGRSDRAAAAAALASRARNVVALTATPHSGDDAAFGRLCAMGDIDRRFPLLMFRRRRCDINLSSRRRTTLLQVRPSKAELAMHEALLTYTRLVWHQSSGGWGRSDGRLAAIVLMRRACSSASSLCRSIERRLSLLRAEPAEGVAQLTLPLAGELVGDEAPDAELGIPGLQDPRDERLHLEHILGCARSAVIAETKILALHRLMRRVREPVLVFTEYRDTLQQIASTLQATGAAVLHGGLSQSERSTVLRLFTHGGAPVLLATDAASEGLNLHHRCRLVVSLELPWTPTRLEQRIGRLDRLGQRRTVHAIHFTAAGTSEEVVLAKLARRSSRAAAALQDTGIPRWRDERDVAHVVIERQDPPDVHQHAQPVLADDILRPDLRPAADAETRRLLTARILAQFDSVPSADSRPAVTVLRRRRRGKPIFCWAFRLVVELSTSSAPWQPILGICGTCGALASRRQLSRMLAIGHASIDEAFRQAATEALHALNREQAPLIELMRAREQAIAATLQRRHARLAVDLLQRSLFDHRLERLDAAQSAMLEAAIGATAERLRSFAAAPDSGTAEHALVFAIARR